MTILLTAEARLAEVRGPKIAIYGRPGVGKTYLLNTLSAKVLAKTILVDTDAGDSCIAHLKVASTRPRTWKEIRDLACAAAGPNPAVAANAPYSEAHYRSVMANPDLAALAEFELFYMDSLSETARRCRDWAEQQDEAYSRGKKDLRGMYGLVARELIAWLQQLQHMRSRIVIFVTVLEKVIDDFNVSTWRPQIEGQRTANVLPAIVDEILTLEFLDFGDHKPVRAFVTREPNPWNLPGKDRSGKLDQFEPPDLGKLLAKLTAPKPQPDGGIS
jgi:hypothetical protein